MKIFSHTLLAINSRRIILAAAILFSSVAYSRGQAPAGGQQPAVLTNSSIIQMKTIGFTPKFIINQIASSPCNFTTDLTSLAALKNANVDEPVIDAMIKKGQQQPAATAPPAAAAAPPAPAPVVTAPPVVAPPMVVAAPPATAPPVLAAAPCPVCGPVIPPSKLGTMIDDETYITTKGVFYSVGQKIRLGSGVAQGGGFRYIMDFNLLNSPEYDKHAGTEWANKEVVISKIMVVSGDPKVVFVIFKTTTIKKSGINIEAAITAGEVVQ